MVEPGPVEVMWERMDIPEVAESLKIANVYSREDLMANLLLGPVELARLVAEVPPFEDDLPYVEYTSGRLMARELTWYDNLTMLINARAVDGCFPEGAGDWPSVAAHRDRRLREIMQQLHGDLVDQP